MWDKYKNHIIVGIVGAAASIITYSTWDLIKDTHNHVYDIYHAADSDISDIKKTLDQIDTVVKNNEFRLNQIRYNYLVHKREEHGLDQFESMELSNLHARLFPGQVP